MSTAGIAKRVEKRETKRVSVRLRLEDHLTFAAYACLLFCFVFGCLSFIAVINLEIPAPLSFVLASSSVAFVFSGYITCLVLRWMAETLQLKKEGLGYQPAKNLPGLESQKATYFACGNCNARLHSDLHCEVCGAKISS